ncbi:movement protein [Passion fruit chlorotic mottle virus]|uniref:Movement protein BC1 n=1 Tax=Passion fruit chlorotic mottle virus TaxID=2162638 RepID=A0A2R4Q8V2_9GEMI|nr:movement protein [Passion fruit chlorotic mottle virus]AVY03270.1 movement protein [Passion fruit chlorotic mottle virus]
MQMLFFLIRMSDSQIKVFNEYHSSKRVEYPLTNEKTMIKLEFPSMGDISWSRLKGHCLKIDHCQISYTPQVPANASGNVCFEIHDMRMEADKTLQAEYTVPIRCAVELNFFSTSFFSMKDDVPWEVFYSVENSDVRSGTRFCKMKARVKLSSAKHSTHINFRSPTIKIISRGFSERDVDFHHVAIPKAERLLCRGSSVITSRPRFEIEAGDSWASKSSIGGSDVDYPYKELGRLNADALEIGPSASQVGIGPGNEPNKGKVVMDAVEFAEVVADAVRHGSVINNNIINDNKKKAPA